MVERVSNSVDLAASAGISLSEEGMSIGLVGSHLVSRHVFLLPEQWFGLDRQEHQPRMSMDFKTITQTTYHKDFLI